jgi:exosortase
MLEAGMSSEESNHAQHRFGRPTVLVALLVVAHIPFLIPYLKQLWELDHYQFYPFAIAGLIWMVNQRRDPERFLWSFRSTLLIVADIGLVVIGISIPSPWPVVAGLVCSIAGLLLACREKTSNRSLFYLTLLPLMVLRLPLNLDLRLINWLQTKTTVAASSLLNHLRYTHFRSGNVIEFSDKSLMVEEACSGVQSLFTVFFVAVVIICWRRRPWMHSILLLVSAWFWAACMNVVRVTGIAIAWRSFGLDLTAGWSHTAWGHVILILSILLLLSTDSLLEGLTAYVPDLRNESERFRNPAMSIWNWLFEPHLPLPPALIKNERAQLNRLAPWFLRSIPVVAVVAGLLFVGQTTQAFNKSRSAASPLILSSSLELFRKSDLPEDLEGWAQSGYTTETRSLSSSFGQYSNSWTYTNVDQPVHISCDHVFRGWHHLEVCYTGNGWSVEKRQIVRAETTDDTTDNWPVVEVELSRPTGEKSLLVYSFFDAAGRSVMPPEASTRAALIDRILRRSTIQLQGFTSATYQAQVFVEIPGAMGQDQRDDIHRKHRQSRELLRDAYSSRR